MKYIKLFENKVLDDILDKISKNGKSSLTDLEKDFLNNYGTNKQSSVENKLMKKDEPYKDVLTDTQRNPESYDDFSDEDSGDYSDADDKKYKDLWMQLYDEDMDNFMRKYRLPEDIVQLPWNQLHNRIKTYFKNFIKDIGLLD